MNEGQPINATEHFLEKEDLIETLIDQNRPPFGFQNFEAGTPGGQVELLVFCFVPS